MVHLLSFIRQARRCWTRPAGIRRLEVNNTAVLPEVTETLTALRDIHEQRGVDKFYFVLCEELCIPTRHIRLWPLGQRQAMI